MLEVALSKAKKEQARPDSHIKDLTQFILHKETEAQSFTALLTQESGIISFVENRRDAGPQLVHK